MTTNFRVDQAKASNARQPIFSTAFMACLYALVLEPLYLFFTYTQSSVRGTMETSIENRLFWPILTAIALFSSMRNFSRRGNTYWPPHIISLFLCIAFAGASVLWAFSPELSLTRYVREVMVIISVVLPGVAAIRASDMMRGLFVCFGISVTLNIVFLCEGYQQVLDHVSIGYSGYFLGKNYLGECAAVALLLSLHELFYSGLRRALAVAVAVGSVVLLLYSSSKTSLGLALLAPLVAALLWLIKRCCRVPPGVAVLAIVFGYQLFAKLTGFTMNKVSYWVYGNYTFTNRQLIWDYVFTEIAHKPILGWGYESFWFVGPGGPSITNASGWVKTMPNGHNGYYDIMLTMGYVGFALLAMFITTMLNAIGKILDCDRPRGWVALSLAVFVIMHNGLESTWLRSFEFMWIVSLMIAVDAVRFWSSPAAGHAMYKIGPQKLNYRTQFGGTGSNRGRTQPMANAAVRHGGSGPRRASPH